MRPGAVPPPGQGAALDPLAVVRAAMAGEQAETDAPKRRMAGSEFSMTTVSPTLRKLGILYAIYLCFNSLRVQEVITALAIPKLPMAMSLAIAVGLVVGVPASGWQLLWRGSSALRWQSLLALLAIVTIPLGIWMGNSFQELYPGYAISVTVFVAGVVLLRDVKVLLRTLQILAGTLSLITMLVLLGIGASFVGSEGRLMVGASLDPNDFAWILATFFPIVLWLGIRRASTAIFWFSCAVLLLTGIARTQSRGGFLALLSAVVILIFFGFKGWRRIGMLVSLLIVGSLFIAYINTSGASRLTDLGGYDGGTGRLDLWKNGVEWMLRRPWGYGMGNFSEYNIWMTRGYHAAHSAYIGIGVELGMLGGVAFAAIWVGILKGLYVIRASLSADYTNRRSREASVMYGFMMSALVANAVGSAFLNTQYAALTLMVQSLGAALVMNGTALQQAVAPHRVKAGPKTPRTTGRHHLARSRGPGQ